MDGTVNYGSRAHSQADVAADFIGEPPFDHDFDHVDYDATEFDQRAGTPGLHTVAEKVQAQSRETLLPPDLFNRFANDAFWRDPQQVRAALRVA